MKTKQIRIEFSIAGKGNPNKEGKDGKWGFNHARNGASQLADVKADNCIFMKANIYKVGEGIVRVVKVSGDCVRHNAFGSTNNAAIKEDISTLIAFDTSKEGLVRGFFNPNGGKRKSPLTVTDAEEDSGAVSQLEMKSSSGARTDTSFYGKETIGKSHFSGEAFIDLSELGIISCCETFSRACVRPELQQIYEDGLRANGIEFTKGAYCKKSDVQPEICYKLSDKSVNDLVNYFLKKLASLKINNATEYIEFEKMKIIFVQEDGTREEVGFSNGKLETTFEVASQYTEASYEDALKAEEKTRELIQATKDKGSKKKGKKPESTTATEA